MKYLPFLDGKYSTAPGLNAMAKAEPSDQFVFQLDDEYDRYMGNKLRCRKEDIQKYFFTDRLSEETGRHVNQRIVQLLTSEYPGDFILTTDTEGFHLYNNRTSTKLDWKEDWIHVDQPDYQLLFDALCSQVQEDVAICQLQDENDWLAAIHLSAPNHWSPAEKIGRPFSAVHGVVPGMEKLNQQYFKMLQTAVQKGPFIRFAWGIATDTYLNHHPLPPPGEDPIGWQGRSVAADTEHIYVRSERQTITGIPDRQAFLFTIRTYFYDIDQLSGVEKSALISAVETMSPSSLEYKGLTGRVDTLRQRLR